MSCQFKPDRKNDTFVSVNCEKQVILHTHYDNGNPVFYSAEIFDVPDDNTSPKRVVTRTLLDDLLENLLKTEVWY